MLKLANLTTQRALIATVLLLAVALGYWLWFGLTLRNIHFDEGVSILAAQGILEHGYPQLPSGFFYGRGYVPHYLLAASIRVFGLNSFSIMLPSLIMGLGSLLLVFQIAKNVIGKPWIGVAAIILLLVLQLETWYATSPRMYMALQFFSLLAVYATWRGYIQDEGKYKIVTAFAIIAVILSHRQGVILAVALPVPALAIMWMRGEKWSSILSFQNLVSILVVGFMVLFVVAYNSPNPMPGVVMHDGDSPNRIGLNLNAIYWGTHLVHLEETLPYGLPVLLVTYFLVFRSFLRRLNVSEGLVYLLLVFTISVLLFGMIARELLGPRFYFFVLPIFALLVCVGGVTLTQILVPRWHSRFKLSVAGQIVVLSLLIGGGLISLGMATLQETGPYTGGSATQFIKNSLSQGPKVLGLTKRGYGLPCADKACDRSLKRLYQVMNRSVGPGDLVISGQPTETNYYLGQVDGYLRQKMESGALSPFESQKDEYFGIPLIDTVDELVELGKSEHRVWVIADASEGERYFKFLEGTRFTVYVNHFD